MPKNGDPKPAPVEENPQANVQPQNVIVSNDDEPQNIPHFFLNCRFSLQKAV